MATHFHERLYDKGCAESLARAGVLPALARVLSARGIRSAEDLAEDWKSLINPSHLEGLDAASLLLADARKNHRHVTIVADYDCDGATACAVAIRGLRAMGISTDYIVPSRFKFGYGLSPEIVDLAMNRPQKPDIILTVDNGIASIEGTKRANELGAAVIITDHHLAGEQIPEAAAIVNPNLPNSLFPSKSLAGCGVMYYLLLALRAKLREAGIFTPASQPRLDVLSDLVALGTVADVVSLDKNNRILVSQGLARVRQGKACAGIQALFETCGRDRSRVTARDFAFCIAPRINAAGRLTEMDVGIECLLTDDAERALFLAQELNRLNEERRGLEEIMQTDAFSRVRKMDTAHKASIVLFDQAWHQGLVGLVASRVKDKFHRPVIAFAPDEADTLKGSGRSVEGVHLRDILEQLDKEAPGVMKRYGGHAMAAGLTIDRAQLDRFENLFESAVRTHCSSNTLNKCVEVDGPLRAEDINFLLIDALQSRIWGQGFDEPVFANEFIVLNQRVLKGEHLKLLLELDGTRFDAIFFRHEKPLPSHVRLAYKPEINTFMGRRSVQLVIVEAED